MNVDLFPVGIDPRKPHPQSHKFKTYVPSHESVKLVREFWQNFVSNYERYIQSKEKDVDELKGGFWSDRDTKFVQDRKEKIRTFKTKIENLDSFQRDAGIVWAAGGKRNPELGPKFVLDWALIKLDTTSREYVNFVSHAHPVFLQYHTK